MKSEQGSVAMTNRAILKEEIDIEEEVYVDLTIDTNESNNTSDCSLPESNPSSNNSHSKPITQESPSKQVIDLTSNDNDICIGIDDSLQVSHVKGTFSLETIGSKTLVVFRRLPGEPSSKSTDKEVSEYPCSKCNSVFYSGVLLSEHINKAHSLDEVKKKILEGRYILICSKCKTPKTSNSVANCPCSADIHYRCQQCNLIFLKYESLSNHLLMHCSPEGYYHCQQCGYSSINFNFVNRHVWTKHPDLGTNFDPRTIVWKEAHADADGRGHSAHTCLKCNREFSSIQSLNQHIRRRCRRIKVFKSMGSDDGLEFRIDKNAQVNGRHIVPHCRECNNDTEFYRYIGDQPSCTTCKSVLVFKCTLCHKLMDHNVYIEHVKSICNPLKKLYSCRLCPTNFHSCVSLLEHKKQHKRDSNRLAELPAERRSTTGALQRSDISCDKSINGFDARKDTLSSSNQEKKSSILFASQKYNAIFAEKCELTREPKHFDNKLRMQCKVLLTPLNIHKS